MLEFALWPLWRALKGPLKSVLGENFSVVGGQLKTILSSTVDDLVNALQEEYWNTQTRRHQAKGVIWKNGGSKLGDKILSVEIFPIDAILNATNIQKALVDHLRKNTPLDALRNTAGIKDSDWEIILDTYAADVVRHATPFALRRMVKNELPLYLQVRVIDIAKLEPVRIQGVAGYHTLVVLYDGPTDYNRPTVSKAKKIWKKRGSSAYQYELDTYDGFTAA